MSLQEIFGLIGVLLAGILIGRMRKKPEPEVVDDIDENPEITVEEAPTDEYYFPDNLEEAQAATQIYIWLCDAEEDIDKQMMSKVDQNRFSALKQMALRIAHIHMKDKYEELFPKNSSEEKE